MSRPRSPTPLARQDATPNSPQGEPRATSRTAKVKHVAYLQLKEFLIVFLYLWLIFALFDAQKAIILAREHVEFTPYGFALINALALAKFMLIGKEMNLADNIFKQKPLIYPTLLKSLIFAILLTILRILEEVAVHLFKGHSFEESLSALGDHNAKIVVTAGVIMFVMLIPFFAFTELSHHFGEGRLGRLFLHSRHNWLEDNGAKGETRPPSPGKLPGFDVPAEKSASL
jgi:hypothetical protein